VEAAPGKAFLSKRLCRRIKISQPCSSARCRRNASRATRRTRLRVTARGANFLPITSPSRAGAPFARPYRTKCSVRAHGRKRKTDENSSVFKSLAAFGKLAARAINVNSIERSRRSRLASHGHKHERRRRDHYRPQTARRLRPFARRALMTLRPPAVFMRTRKPWVRLRRVTDG